MLTTIRAWLTSDSAHRVARTFAITFAAILIPGLLGWLHALTAWAQADGQAPFPDGHTLAYLAVSAIGAAVIAVVNLLWVMIEDATGKGILRTPGTTTTTAPAPAAPRKRSEAGQITLPDLVPIMVLATLVFVVLLFAGVHA